MSTRPNTPAKPYPSEKRRRSFYLRDTVQEELQGAENSSERLDDIAHRLALFRRELCPALSAEAWTAVFSVLRAPMPLGVAEEDAAELIAGWLTQHHTALTERLGLDVKALVKVVSRWTPGQAWAVIDVAWRFWRMSEQLTLRNKLSLLGIEVK